MNKIKWIKGTIGFLLLTICTLTFLSFSASPKTGYISSGQLFEGFKGKLELEQKFTAAEIEQQAMLDTLSLELVSIAKDLTEHKHDKTLLEKQRQKEYLYRQLQERFSEKSIAQNREYTEAAWKQINTYLKEFGKEKGYDYIFGASGNGSLMFAKGDCDITEEVLEYINQKYEGL